MWRSATIHSRSASGSVSWRRDGRVPSTRVGVDGSRAARRRRSNPCVGDLGGARRGIAARARPRPPRTAAAPRRRAPAGSRRPAGRRARSPRRRPRARRRRERRRATGRRSLRAAGARLARRREPRSGRGRGRGGRAGSTGARPGGRCGAGSPPSRRGSGARGARRGRRADRRPTSRSRRASPSSRARSRSRSSPGGDDRRRRPGTALARARGDVVARREEPVDPREEPVALVAPRRVAEPLGVDEGRHRRRLGLEQRDVREACDARVEPVHDVEAAAPEGECDVRADADRDSDRRARARRGRPATARRRPSSWPLCSARRAGRGARPSATTAPARRRCARVREARPRRLPRARSCRAAPTTRAGSRGRCGAPRGTIVGASVASPVRRRRASRLGPRLYSVSTISCWRTSTRPPSRSSARQAGWPTGRLSTLSGSPSVRAAAREQPVSGSCVARELEDADAAAGDATHGGRAVDRSPCASAHLRERRVVALPRLALGAVRADPRVRLRCVDVARRVAVGRRRATRPRRRGRARSRAARRGRRAGVLDDHLEPDALDAARASLVVHRLHQRAAGAPAPLGGDDAERRRSTRPRRAARGSRGRPARRRGPRRATRRGRGRTSS